MPAATTKTGLFDVTEKEFAKLKDLLQTVDEAEAMRKDAENTSIRDVIAHRAHWIGLFFGWYDDGLAGKDVALPAPGYKWSELKRYNAMLRDRYAAMAWDEARMNLSDQHARLKAWILARTESELYGGPMKGGKNDWTPGRWAEAAGPSHYRSAVKYIRARLRASAH